MTVSIKEHFKHHTAQESIELKRLANARQDDLEAIHAAILGITAKLDADVGINDVDYAALHDPAALTVTK